MPKDVADVLAKLAFKEQQAEAADRSKAKNEEKQKRDRDRNRLSLQNKKTEEADRTQYKPLVPYSPAPTPTAFGAENVDDYTSWSLDHLQSERDRINGTIAQNEVQIARTIDPVARQKLIDDTDALRGTVDSLEKQIHVLRPASVVSEEATAASEKKKRGVWDAIMGTLNSYTQAELATASSLTGKKEKAGGYKDTAESEMERSIAGSAAHREGRAEEKALNAELLDAREGNHLTTNERYEKTTRYRELSQSVVARMFNADELSDEERKQLEADTAELKQLQSELGSDYLNGIERVGAGIQGALFGIEKGLASDVAWLGEKAPQMVGNTLFQGGGPMGDIAGILLQAGAPYLRKFAGIMSEKQQDIQKLANKNATSGEKTSYNAVQSGTEMAFDTAMAALTGVGGLTFMGLRVFGGSSQDALDSGASEAQAIAYGATHAGIEVLSEKMFDVMGIYGGGYGDDLAKNVIARTTRNPALAKLMVIAFAGIEEPIEEVAAGIADPAAEFWINGEKLTAENLLSKYDSEWAGEIGEAMLVANILGTLGGTVEVTRNGIQSRNGNALEIGSEEWRQEIMSPKVRKSLEDAGIDIGEVEQAIAEAQQALVDRVVEIETQQTHGPRGHSASTHTEEGRTPAQQALHDMDISDGATSANVAEILSSPELKAEFEQIAGVKIEGTPEQQAQIIQDNAQKVGEYVGYKYAESPTEATATEAVEESEPAKALAPTVEEQREEQRQLRQKETPAEVPTETPVADALAPNVNNEAEAVNEESVPEAEETAEEQNVPEALVPETEEQTEQPAEETPAEETPAKVTNSVADAIAKGADISNAEINRIIQSEEAVAAIEEIIGELPEEGKAAAIRAFAQDAVAEGMDISALENIEMPEAPVKPKTRDKVAETLRTKGGQITDMEAFDLLLKNRKALIDLGFDPSLTDTAEQVAAVRALAEDIANNQGAPSEEAVAKIKQDRNIESPEQQLQYQIDQLTEEIKAAEMRGDAERVKALADQRAKYEQRLAEQKARADERLAKTKEGFKETQRREDLLGKIKKTSNNITKGLTNQGEKNYVPSDLVEATTEFMQAFNEASIDPNSTSKATQRLADKFAKIERKFKALKTAVDSLGIEGRQYNSVTAELMSDAREILDSGTPLSKMTNDELETISNALSSMNHSLNTERKIHIKGRKETAFQIGEKMTEAIESNGKKSENAKDKYFSLTDRPETFFDHLGGFAKDSPTHIGYDLLNQGENTKTHIQLETSQQFHDLLSQQDNLKSLRKKVTLQGLTDANGKAVQITRDQMLALKMHLMNEQNRNHIAGGGLTVPKLSDYYGNRNNQGFSLGQQHVVGMSQEMNTLTAQLKAAEDSLAANEKAGNDTTEAQAQVDAIKSQMEEFKASEAERLANLEAEIDGQLTDYEKQWISTAQSFFLWAQDQMNLTSDQVYGFAKALVDNYFPIKSDPDFRKGSTDENARTSERDILEKIGITQQRTTSNNPIRLYGIVDTISNYSDSLAKYCGIMPAVKAFNEIMDTRAAGHKWSLRQTIRDTYGDTALKYIDTLVNNLQGKNSKGDIIGDIFGKAKGNFAYSILTGNAPVAGSQAVSWFNSAPVLGWNNLIKSIGKKAPSADFVAQYSDRLSARMSGKDTFKFSDIKTDLQSQRDRITRKFWFALNWISDTDNKTVKNLWPASELYVQENNPELEVGSKEYYEAVGSIFDKAVDRTQPMYTVMQSPGILRSDRDLVRSVTMFMTQRLQNMNECRDDIMTAIKYSQDLKAGKNGVTEADVKSANKAATNAVTSLVVSSLAMQAMKTAVNMLLHRTRNYRDKDTGELTAESITLRTMDYVAETIASTFLGGAELYQLGKVAIDGGRYSGTAVPGLDTISGMIEDIVYAFNASEGKKADALLKAAGSTATLFGVPFDNGKHFVDAALRWAEDFKDKTFLESDYDYTAAQNKNQVYNALLGGDDEKFDNVMDRMAKEHDESYAKERVKETVKDHYEAEDIGVGTAKDMLVRGGYTEKEADDAILGWHTDGIYDDKRADWEKSREDREDTDLDIDLDRARGMEGFADLGADSQKEVLDDVYNYYKHLENKEYAEANGIEYENEKYEKYEDLDDPVARMVLEQKVSPALKKDKKEPGKIAEPDVIDALVGDYLQGNMSEEDNAYIEGHDYFKDLIAGAELDKPIGAEQYFDILDFVQTISRQTSEAKTGTDERDFNAIDEKIKDLDSVLDTPEALSIFQDSYTWIDELLDAADIGMDSKTFYKYYDEYAKIGDPEYRMENGEKPSADDRFNIMVTKITEDDTLTPEQKEFLRARFPQTRFVPVTETKYSQMVDGDVPTEVAMRYVDRWADMKAEADAVGDTVSNTDKAFVILNDDTLSAKERMDYFIASGIKPRQKDLAMWMNVQYHAGNLTLSQVNEYWSDLREKEIVSAATMKRAMGR